MYRVLHLIDSNGFYGAESVVIKLMCEQTANGHIPILGSIHDESIEEKDVERAAVEQGMQVWKIKMGRWPDVFQGAKLVKRAIAGGVTVIHCHGYKANIILGLLPRWLVKIPYVSTLHGWTHTKGAKGSLKMLIYAWVDALMAKRANAAVVVSQAMQTDRRVKAVGLKTLVVPNGIPGVGLQGNAANPYVWARKGRIVLGAIGRLSPEKGFVVLLQALGRLLGNGFDVVLVVMGDGPELYALKKLSIELGLADKVEFVGYVSNASRYLSSVDIFVLSSFTEGLPITILEAMRAGKPIVATAVGGVPEALEYGKCGILVKPGDPTGLAIGISSLIRSPETQSMLGEKARCRFKELYDSRVMEMRYSAIYAAVLSSAHLSYSNRLF